MLGIPHPALRPYLSSYVGYHQVGGLPAVHHGVPSPTATVIVAFDDPLDVGWAHQSQRSQRYWTLAAGLHTKPALIYTHQSQHGIQLDLTPLGCRRLLGLPVAALAHAMVTHEEVPLGLAPDVAARLQEASTWGQRFAILDQALLTVLRRSDETHVHPAAAEGWRAVAQSHGLASITEIAREIGWSRRHLAARFRDEFGVTPKEVARLFRFDRARRLAGAGMPLVQVALAAGYADQAHLCREWRALAGQSPRDTRAEQLSFVQDPNHVAAASS